MATEVLESHIVIDAPIEKVWSIVSNLKNMGERSPQCRKVFVFGGPIAEGTRMVNVNRQGWKVWPTTAKVVDFRPSERIAFRIIENHTVWSYSLATTEDGKVNLTERRDAPGGRTSLLSSVLVRALLGGEHTLERNLSAGMAQTLARIKSEAETS